MLEGVLESVSTGYGALIGCIDRGLCVDGGDSHTRDISRFNGILKS